jgi:hypothetical protein
MPYVSEESLSPLNIKPHTEIKILYISSDNNALVAKNLASGDIGVIASAACSMNAANHDSSIVGTSSPTIPQRKETKRGHGINFSQSQKCKFAQPCTSPCHFLTLDYESLQKILDTLESYLTNGKAVRFSELAVRKASDVVSTYNDRRGWRIWASDSLFNKFSHLKSTCVPNKTTNLEFLEMLIMLDQATRLDQTNLVGKLITYSDHSGSLSDVPFTMI